MSERTGLLLRKVLELHSATIMETDTFSNSWKSCMKPLLWASFHGHLNGQSDDVEDRVPSTTLSLGTVGWTSKCPYLSITQDVTLAWNHLLTAFLLTLRSVRFPHHQSDTSCGVLNDV